MRLIRASLNAVGVSPWIPLNNQHTINNTSVAVTIGLGVSCTYSVQHSYDDPNYGLPCKITRSSTTAVMTLSNHGLAAADSIVITGAGAPFDGTWPLSSVVDVNTVTFDVANSGLTASNQDAKCAVVRVYTPGVFSNRTSSGENAYTAPLKAIRLVVSARTAGTAYMTIIQSD